MADKWRSDPSPQQRTARAVQAMTPGSLHGRVQRASPRPKRVQQQPTSDINVWIGQDGPPDTPNGRLWFKLPSNASSA